MRFFLRQGTNVLMIGGTCLATLAALIPLFLILGHLFSKGFASLNLQFLIELPKPVGETGGGMANAIAGTGVMIAVACGIGLPVGLLGGIYLSEFGRGKFAHLVRFVTDVLNGTPSIVIGIFVYVLLVLPMRSFSGLAGGVALGVMMIPTVLRAAEEMLKLVPVSLREAALGLGLPYWKMMLRVVLKTARAGIVTGVLLAVARVAGETAPLLFTALGNQFWNLKLTEPMAAIPLQIFVFAISPYEEWQRQAWAGALLLIGFVLTLNVVCRFFIRGPAGGR